MNRLTQIVAIVIAVGALAFTGNSAFAAQCPPGTIDPDSGVDQYSESIPGSCGNQNPNGGEGSGANDDAVAPATASDLEDLGQQGAAVAALATATSPDTGSGGSGEGEGDEQGQANGSQDGVTGLAAGGAAVEESGSGLGALVGALTGDSGDGIGLLLPLALIGVAAVLLAGLIRRRSRPDPSQP